MILSMVGVVLRGARLPVMTMYAVYDRPLDFPDEVVARRWDIGMTGPLPKAGPVVARGRTVEEVRAQLPAGLYRLGRNPSDPLAVVEKWI